MSLLIKALNKADEVQAEKTKDAEASKTSKTQKLELALESSSPSKPSNKSINKPLAKPAQDAGLSGPALEVLAEPQQAPANKASNNPQNQQQPAAKNAANVFTAKGAQTKANGSRLALIGGAGLIALLGMGVYFYQFVDNTPPIVVPPRPLEPFDQTAQTNAPTQTAELEAPVNATESAPLSEPVAEPSLPPAFVPDETAAAEKTKKTKKVPTASMFTNDENEAAEIAQAPVSDLPVNSAAIEDTLSDNEQDISRLEASFSSNKMGKKTRKPKNSAAIASESASISVTKSAPETGVNPILMSAYEAYNAGKDAEAQKLYKQVLKRDIQNVDALLGLGAIAARQGCIADANSWYGKVLEQEPRNSIAKAFMLDNQMQASQVQGNELNNETNLKNMLAKQPDDANLHAALGNLYADQNNWPAAQQAYFDAYRLNKTAENAYNLAVSLDQMGKPKLALPYYQRALEQANDSNAIDKAALQARISAIQ